MSKNNKVEDVIEQFIKIGLDVKQMEALSGEIADFLEEADNQGVLEDLLTDSMSKLAECSNLSKTANPAAAAGAAPAVGGYLGWKTILPAAYLASLGSRTADTAIGAAGGLAKSIASAGGKALLPLGALSLAAPFFIGRFGGELSADALHNHDAEAERKYIQDQEILAALREATRQVKQRSGLPSNYSVDTGTDFS